MTTPTITVNGEQRAVAGVEPHVTALDWLRDQGLTGAKEGCAEGECGACSVLVARPDGAAPDGSGRTRWTALNACLVPALALDGQEVVTAEGLGRPGALHPVQREMAVRGGSQCGYCTPGFICSMAAEYYRPDRAVDRSDHQRARRRGRRARPQRVRPARAERQPVPLHRLPADPRRRLRPRVTDPGTTSWPRRCAAPAPAVVSTRVRSERAEFARPADLADALALLARAARRHGDRGLHGLGVEVNLRGTRAPFVVAVDRLPELRTFSVGADVVEIGAALTLSEAERLLDGRVPLLDQLFPQFASRLIRNGATLGGNLGTGSPIGDAPPALLALEASVVLAGPTGEREVPLASYFTGYRRSVRRAGRAHPRRADPAAAGPARRLPQDRQAAVRRHLQRRGGLRPRRPGRRRRAGRDRARRCRGDTAAGHRHRGRPRRAGRGPRTPSRDAAAVLRGEGTPIDDHRASAAYRAAMLGQSLLKFHTETRRRRCRHDCAAARVRSAPSSGRRSRTRAPSCTSPASRCTPTTWSTGTPACSTPTRCRPRTPMPG